MNKLYIFFTGIIAALGALFLELTLNFFCFDCKQTATDPSSFHPFLLLTAVLIEEIFKFSIIFWNASRLEGYKKIITASILCGAGFSFAEIFFFHSNELFFQPGQQIQLIGIALVHITTSAIMGFSLASLGIKIGYYALLTVLLTSLLHLAYNLSLIY